MLFDSWARLGQVLLVGALACAALVLLLRISGKRTLTKLDAFDLVVTVGLGSTLVTVLLSNQGALAAGVLALALLISLRYGIAWRSVRSAGFRALVKSKPMLLLHRGRYLHGAMRRSGSRTKRSSRPCAQAASPTRAAPLPLVLETDGTLSVIAAADPSGEVATLDTVRPVDPDQQRACRPGGQPSSRNQEERS